MRAALFAIALTTSVAAEPWEVCQSVSYVEPQRFYLSCWGGEGRQLHGRFTHIGSLASERPRVALQISHGWDGPWTTVGRVRAVREALPQHPRGRVEWLHVTLDAFRPYLHSHQCGRIVLSSGEAAGVDIPKLRGDTTREK